MKELRRCLRLKDSDLPDKCIEKLGDSEDGVGEQLEPVGEAEVVVGTRNPDRRQEGVHHKHLVVRDCICVY